MESSHDLYRTTVSLSVAVPTIKLVSPGRLFDHKAGGSATSAGFLMVRSESKKARRESPDLSG